LLCKQNGIEEKKKKEKKKKLFSFWILESEEFLESLNFLLFFHGYTGISEFETGSFNPLVQDLKLPVGMDPFFRSLQYNYTA
jgi:hypothetical protein